MPGSPTTTSALPKRDVHHSPNLSAWIPEDILIANQPKYKFLNARLTDSDIGLTLAEVLLHRLLAIWTPTPTDLDRVVMIHRIEYEQDGKAYQSIFEMDLTGDTSTSAMSHTVSLPIYLIVKLFLNKQLITSGSLTVMDEPLRSQLYKAFTDSGLPMKESAIQL